MKLTVVTEKDNIIGVVFGHTPQPAPDNSNGEGETTFRAGLMAGPGQELHVIEASEKIMAINSPKELLAEVHAHLKKRAS